MPVYSRHGNYHKLGTNTGNATPQRAFFLDVESKHTVDTDTEHHRLKLAWTFYYRKDRYNLYSPRYWEKHDDPFAMWRYIVSYTSTSHPLFIFGHNLYFDLQVSGFFEYLTAWGWTCDFVYDKGMSYIISLHKANKYIKCISTTNFFGFSAEALGKIVGQEKIGINLQKAGIDEVSEYCKKQCDATTCFLFRCRE